MYNFDLKYICKVIGNLSGIPVRLYEQKKLTYYHSVVKLPIDPIKIYEQNILGIPDHIGYYVTPYFNYFGIVNTGDIKFVIGPTRQISNTEQQLKEFAFMSNVPDAFVDDFITGMKSIIPMPLDSILQMMCVINHILNGEHIELKDISIIDNEQNIITNTLESEQADKTINDYVALDKNLHNTYPLEQAIQNMVSNGDTSSFKKWASEAQAVRGGTVAFDQIRQLKNTFIVTTTLVSRAAIKGGLDVNESLTLSDMYIQKVELTNTMNGITNLQYHMILDYTERVEKLRRGNNTSELQLEITNYIHHNISSTITTKKIADHLKISRTHLSQKFHNETGITLIDFIQQEKINEAKKLLRYTNKPIIDISNFLAYSSQSHFNRSFKKYTKLSPKEYRDSINKI